MKILMVGNTASLNYYLSEGLKKYGHEVILVGKKHLVLTEKYDYNLSLKNSIFKGYGKNFDIIHMDSPNMSIRKFPVYLWYAKNSKVVCHWHGSDLRIWNKIFPLKDWYLKNCAFHLYSTIDLAWYLKSVPDNKKMLFRSPIDINLFKPIIPIKMRRYNKLIWGKGRLSEQEWIPHNKVPELLNKYKVVETYPSLGLSPYLISVSALEAAVCDCKVVHHPYMTCKWVIENASIESQTKKLLEIYKRVLED